MSGFTQKANSSSGDARLDYALRYLRHGLAVIRTHGKHPIDKDWPNLRASEDEIRNWYGDGSDLNIAVVLGEPSGNIVDVDLDAPETVAVAEALLPDTGWIFGKPSRQRSHLLYRADRLGRNIQLEDPLPREGDAAGATLIELRGSSKKLTVPPSIHPSGELISWAAFTEPAEVAWNDLAARVHQVAAAALLARHWPANGSRHHVALPLGGALAHIRYPQEDAEQLVRVVATAVGDEEAERDRVRAVRTSYEECANGRNTTGWPTLATVLGQERGPVIDRVREWLKVAMDLAHGRPAPSNAKSRATYRPLPERQPFPVDALPPVLSELAPAAAGAIGCDPSAMACHSLAVTAGCIGNARALNLKRRWTEPCVIWTLVLAESGKLKTPPWHVSVEPVLDIQMDLLDESRKGVEEFNKNVAEWETRPKDERGKKPEKPGEPVTYITQGQRALWVIWVDWRPSDRAVYHPR